MMAWLNNDDADGTASKALIILAPELCPASVIFEALPPKLGATFCRNFNDVIMSLTARFVAPDGAMNPRAPRRYWTTATIEFVAVARLDPSRPWFVAEPVMNDPP
jgi:hypothetical protein